MKKHISVFQLMIRSNFYRVSGLLVVMVVLQTGLFWIALNSEVSADGFGLEYVFKISHIELVFIGVFIAMNIFLRTAVGYDYDKGKQHYTMMRLSVTRKEVYYCHVVSNVLYYLLFYTIQTLTAVMLGMMYLKFAPAEYVTGQTLFLACYRSAFLHSLLPLGDFPYWIRNLLVLIAAGFWSAYYPKEEEAEKKKKQFPGFVVLPVLYSRGLGDYTNCTILIIYAVGYLIWINNHVRKEEMEIRQEETSGEVSS